MDAEQQADDGHDDQGSGPGREGVRLDEVVAEVDHQQRTGQVEPVTRRQQHRLAADLAREFAEGNDRAGEGDGADVDADVDLEFVDGFLGAGEDDRGVNVAGKADQASRQADQAVHQRNQLGHLRHLHGAGSIEADAAADDHGADDPGDAGQADPRAEDGCQHGDGHADDAVEVAAPRGFRVGQTTEAENEEDGGTNVGGDREVGGHGLIS